MPTGQGIKARAAWKREAVTYEPTWPGPTELATALLPLASDALEPDFDIAQDYQIEGHGGQTEGDTVAKRFNGPIVLQSLSYHRLQGILCAALGFEAYSVGGTQLPEELSAQVPATLGSGTLGSGIFLGGGGAVGAYRHLLEVDHGLADSCWELGEGWTLGEGLTLGTQKVRRGTYIVDKQTAVREWRGAMIRSMVFSATPRAVQLALDMLAYDLDLASMLNTTTTLDNAQTSVGPHLRFQDATIRIGTFSASTALDSTNDIICDSVRITLDNSLMQRPNIDTGLYIAPPDRDGVVSVLAEFGIARHQNTTQISRLLNESELMATVDFTGEEIGSTGVNYRWTWYLPSIRLRRAQVPVQGPQVMREFLIGQTSRPTQTPAGFPANVKGGPLMLEIVNTEPGHPLL